MPARGSDWGEQIWITRLVKGKLKQETRALRIKYWWIFWLNHPACWLRTKSYISRLKKKCSKPPQKGDINLMISGYIPSCMLNFWGPDYPTLASETSPACLTGVISNPGTLGLTRDTYPSIHLSIYLPIHLSHYISNFLTNYSFNYPTWSNPLVISLPYLDSNWSIGAWTIAYLMYIYICVYMFYLYLHGFMGHISHLYNVNDPPMGVLNITSLARPGTRATRHQEVAEEVAAWSVSLTLTRVLRIMQAQKLQAEMGRGRRWPWVPIGVPQ